MIPASSALIQERVEANVEESKAILSVSGLTKRYTSAAGGRQVVAFEDLTFRLKSGEIMALLGPSGCGKSTLLKVIAGLERPTSGRVAFKGAELTQPDAQIGIVFQEDRLLPWLTVRENIAFSRRFAVNKRVVDPGTNVRTEEATRTVETVISRLGLAEFSDAYPSEISGGMAQRVALARALLRRPELLLFDEPFAALDAFNRMEMQDWVVQILKQQGAAALFVTHDIDEALYVGDRIMIMTPHPGRVASIVDNPIPFPRRREDNRLMEVRQTIIHELMTQGAIGRTNGSSSQ